MKKLILLTVLFFGVQTFAQDIPDLNKSFDDMMAGATQAVEAYATDVVGMTPGQVVIAYLPKGKTFHVVDMKSGCLFTAQARVAILKMDWVVTEVPGSNTCN